MRFFLSTLVLIALFLSCKKSKDTPAPISPNPAKACFTMSPAEDATIDSLIQFSNCSDTTDVTYKWDFGDGVTSSKRNETHAYSEPGEYNVTLTASRTGQEPNVLSKKITVRIKERYVDILPVVTPTDFVETSDGSIYVVGNTSNASEIKLYLSKFDKNLRLKWTKFWSDEHSTTFRSIDVASDGGLLLGGSWDERGYSGPLRIMKTDTSGNVKWTRQYPLNNGVAIDMKKSADGGIIVIAQEDGLLESIGLTLPFTSLIKLTDNGDVSWRKIYNKERIFSAGNVLPLTNGYEFAASSSSMNGCANCYDSLVVAKTDLSGKIVFRKSQRRKSNNSVGGTCMAVTENQLFAIGPDLSFMLMDTDGKLIKTDDMPQEHANWVSSTPGKNFITGSGYTHWNGLWLTSYDPTGSIKWSKRLGRRNKTCFPERGYGIYASSLRDNSILFVGISYKDCPREQESSMYLVKVDENGNVL